MARAALLLPGAVAGVAFGIMATDPAGRPPAGAPFAMVAGGVLAAAASLALLGVGRRGNPRLATLLLVAAALGSGAALGSWRSSGAALPAGPGTVADAVALSTSGSATERAVRGIVIDDPRPREDRQQLILDRVELDGRPVRGRLLAWLPRAIPVGAGDVVAFRARLEQPEDFDGFAYRAYLARQGI